MKKIIGTLLVLISTGTAAAAPANLISAVMQSKSIGNVQDIRRVEVVAAYRCPGCYDVVVMGKNITGEAYVKVSTRLQVDGTYLVKYVEGSK